MELSMVFAALSLLFKATTVYFAAVALRWMFIKRKRWPQAAPRTRFAVVIAARNEEAVIGRLVKSLMEQDYPRELFDVYVAPNNCTDDTAGAAFQAGAQILFCDYPVRQKGDALRQAFCQLDGRGYDAFVVFDADNVGRAIPAQEQRCLLRRRAGGQGPPDGHESKSLLGGRLLRYLF